MRGILRAGVVGLALAAPAQAQDLEKGWSAYLRGDYVTALREFRPLAGAGVAEARRLAREWLKAHP